MIYVVLISPETPSKNGPKMKISEKYIVNLTFFWNKILVLLSFSTFEATAM
jgi:hypothetical protein